MIFMMGMPGVGKSFWGKRMAAHFRVPHIDMDTCFEEQNRVTVSSFITQYGEAAFRVEESRILEQLCSRYAQTDVIVSCGGGTPCFNENIHKMLAVGKLVYLKAPIAHIARQLQNGTAHRPLVKANEVDLENYLEQLLLQREPFYNKAHIIIAINRISVSTFAKILEPCIKQH